MSTALLHCVDLAVRYGRAIRGLAGVTMEVADGDIVALLGPNGAGKTTLLRAITGLLPSHRATIVAGDVRFDGESIATTPTSALVRRGIAQALEGRRLFRSLTVEENLHTGAASIRSRHEAKRNVDAVMERIPFLGQRRDSVTGLLSGGEQQQVAIGRALTSNPRVLVLDEPSLGLAPIMAMQIMELLGQLNDDGLTILLVEQNAELALSLASYAYVLDAGTTVLQGPSRELRVDARVADLYLGRGAVDAPAGVH